MWRALVADDDPDVRAIVQDALVVAGFQVFLAENGRDAILAARSTSFDAAVVDLEMPPSDGLAVLRVLRSLQPGCVSVLLSGNLDLDTVATALAEGDVTRVLRKPANARTIQRTVLNALRSRREQALKHATALMVRDDEGRQALDQCIGGDMTLALQPLVDARSHAVMAHEALLRPQSRVFSGPLELIEAAERHEQVEQLSDAALRLARVRLVDGTAPHRLFVNLHPFQLADPEHFSKQLGMFNTFEARVVFEITERHDLSTLPRAQETLSLIRDAGFAIAVDDLGAGYSSLSALATLKPDFIKVDMSLVRGVDEDAHKRQLVELLVAVGRATGATLIAEGVETLREAETLTACGAHWLQGYHFGRPVV
jgi:EAL domain-containing protein (putative c-di-GMP-specific phosphodiesterase class I)